MINIILASSSPRRKELLQLADLEFSIGSVDIDETVIEDESPQDYIVRMVKTKALEAVRKFGAASGLKDSSDHKGSIENSNTSHNCHQINQPYKLIITADTIGVLADGRSILVKPTDKSDAFDMWEQMSGSHHSVWTAVQLTLINSDAKVIEQQNLLEKTEVKFITLNNSDMESYWNTGEPLDKAGGYAIQGRGAAWVEYIKGSYTNVVGLPLAQTLEAIKDMTTKVKSL